MKEDLPYPKRPTRLPVVLSLDEVQRLIAGAKNLYHRTPLLTLYGTGLRPSEVCHLKVRDIDSQRMLLRVDQGKGRRDREVPLSPTLPTALRENYRWMRPQTYLFPGTVRGWRADKPITAKVIWTAVRDARDPLDGSHTATDETTPRHPPFEVRRRPHSLCHCAGVYGGLGHGVVVFDARHRRRADLAPTRRAGRCGAGSAPVYQTGRPGPPRPGGARVHPTTAGAETPRRHTATALD